MARQLSVPAFMKDWEQRGFTFRRVTAGDTHATWVATGSLQLNLSARGDTSVHPHFITLLRSNSVGSALVYKGDDVSAARGTFLQVANVLNVPNQPRSRIGGVYTGLRNLMQIVKMPMAIALLVDEAERHGGTVRFVRLLDGKFALANVPGNVREQAREIGLFMGTTSDNGHVLLLETI